MKHTTLPIVIPGMLFIYLIWRPPDSPGLERKTFSVCTVVIMLHKQYLKFVLFFRRLFDVPNSGSDLIEDGDQSADEFLSESSHDSDLSITLSDSDLKKLIGDELSDSDISITTDSSDPSPLSDSDVSMATDSPAQYDGNKVAEYNMSDSDASVEY